MRITDILHMGTLAVGILITTKLHAIGPNEDRYYTLASPTDRVVLRANETAIIDATEPFDSSFNWVNLLYQQGAKPPVNVILPLGLANGTMPLSGPGVIMLNTNDAVIYGAEYTGAVGLKVVCKKPWEQYETLAHPSDRIELKAKETAIIEATEGFDWGDNWVNFLYQSGTNDLVNIVLPLGLADGATPLSGPGVIILNTNDAFTYGAEYTGAIGFKIVHQNPLARYKTLAHPGDQFVVKANETAWITGTVGFDPAYNAMNIRYKQGTNDFTNLELGMGPMEEPIPLSGPAVIMLNTNDAFIYGAEYTGAVGLKIIRNGLLQKQ